jgi:hypothetical protein
MSAFKTVSTAGNRTLGVIQTESKLGICSYNDTDCHLIELTEGDERVLVGIFEHFSHIDEATKKRLIKACFIVDMFQHMELPARVNRKDVDISIKRIKSNMNSHLTFEQFVGVFEDLATRTVGFPSFSKFIESKLTAFLRGLID